MRQKNFHTYIFLIALLFFSSHSVFAFDKEELIEKERTKVNLLADEFMEAYFKAHPEKATYFGINTFEHKNLQDRSIKALKQWQTIEDNTLKKANAISLTVLENTPELITIKTLKLLLKANQEERICENHLWNISPLTGWQVELADIARMQNISTNHLKEQALKRWKQMPLYIDQEIINLKEGIKKGYTTPKTVVVNVIEQLTELLKTPIKSSPFYIQEKNKKNSLFNKKFYQLVSNEIYPAIEKYLKFLTEEYLPHARNSTGICALPNGHACYQAMVHKYSTLKESPKNIYKKGRQEVKKIHQKLQQIANAFYPGLNSQQLLQHIKGKQYRFSSKKQILELNHAAFKRAKVLLPKYFMLLPKAKLTIKPHPKYRAMTGAPAEYHPPASDGSREGIIYINLHNPSQSLRADKEATFFHEGIPGHHLQQALGQENSKTHPICYYMQLWNSGYTEGWALYAEKLADEMNLYSTKIDQIGWLSEQLLRAVRLVVDPGLHSQGWSEEEAIQYMLNNTAMPKDKIKAEVKRYIGLPGQATGYMLGFLEIMKLRELAQKRLGQKFNIKVFHHQILKDGTLPLPLLEENVKFWIQARENQ